jgi:hypothetical protein
MRQRISIYLLTLFLAFNLSPFIVSLVVKKSCCFSEKISTNATDNHVVCSIGQSGDKSCCLSDPHSVDEEDQTCNSKNTCDQRCKCNPYFCIHCVKTFISNPFEFTFILPEVFSNQKAKGINDLTEYTFGGDSFHPPIV